MTQMFIIYGSEAWNESKFSKVFYAAYQKTSIDGHPPLRLAFSPCPPDIADKYGVGDPHDVFLRVCPDEMMPQSDKDQIIECVQQGARACQTAMCPVR